MTTGSMLVGLVKLQQQAASIPFGWKFGAEESVGAQGSPVPQGRVRHGACLYFSAGISRDCSAIEAPLLDKCCSSR